MNKSKKWKVGLLFMGLAILTGCTRSFCTIQDKANMMYLYESTVNADGKTNLDQLVESVNKTESYFAPSEQYFTYIEERVAEEVLYKYSVANLTYKNGDEMVTTTYSKISESEELHKSLLTEGTELRKAFVKTNEYSLVKYAEANATSMNSLWKNYDKWREEAVNEKYNLTLKDVGSNYFHVQLKSKFNAYANGITACITPVDREFEGLKLEKKSWGDAFKIGLIEGLLVWPISTMLYYFTIWFGSMGTFGTILAIFLVTLIVRGVLMLMTFKQTMSQQRMTDLSPELEALSGKYPNANTNTYEKQALASEQMALYKKHGVNPFGMFIVLIVQFPIFISVWSAMSGSAILREGNIFGLRLSDNFWNSITHWDGTASWVAIVIFVLMSIMQALSMLLPQYLQKKRNEKVAKMGKNPSKNSTNKQMKIMNYFMLGMIIIMGATLPIAMAIYWFISAFISLGQSLIMSHISTKRTNKDGYVKYKTK